MLAADVIEPESAEARRGTVDGGVRRDMINITLCAQGAVAHRAGPCALPAQKIFVKCECLSLAVYTRLDLPAPFFRFFRALPHAFSVYAVASAPNRKAAFIAAVRPFTHTCRNSRHVIFLPFISQSAAAHSALRCIRRIRHVQARGSIGGIFRGI